jgi:AraC-like DNA-binding protein
MEKNCELHPFGIENGIELSYSELELDCTDTNIMLYDKYKISILLSDGMLVVHDNLVTRTRRGDVLVFRPDEIHFARISRSGLYRFLNIFVPLDFFKNLNLESSRVIDFLEHKEKENFIYCSSEKRETLLSEATHIAGQMDFMSGVEGFTAVLNLLLLLAQAYHSQTEKTSQSDAPTVVSNALEYISRNFGEKITLKDIAEASFCSVTYLSKTFKNYMGCTVYEHLTGYRILTAKKMLQSGKSVAEAGYDCGFGDCSHFIKTFKNLCGMTPLEFKLNQ